VEMGPTLVSMRSLELIKHSVRRSVDLEQFRG